MVNFITNNNNINHTSTPVLNMRLGTVDATILPQSIESRQGFDILYEEFDFGKKLLFR